MLYVIWWRASRSPRAHCVIVRIAGRDPPPKPRVLSTTFCQMYVALHWNAELNATGAKPRLTCVLCDWRSDR